MIPSPDTLILRWLSRRARAAPSEIGAACAMALGEVRSRLVSLESRRLVNGRQDLDVKPARRVYFVTSEGKRAAGIIDARSTT